MRREYLPGAFAAIAFAGAVALFEPARGADVPGITAAASQQATDNNVSASRGKVLIAVSADVPVAFRDTLKRNTKFTSVEIVEDPSITSKHGKIYVDGELMQINVLGRGFATVFIFGALTAPMVYVEEYLKTKKPSIISAKNSP